MVIVSLTAAPAPPVDGEKAFETFAARATLMVRVAAVSLLPALVCNAPMATVLVRLPIDEFPAICTGTVTVQEPPAGIVPSLLLMSVLPDVADTVPPQVVEAAGLAATVKPDPIVVRLS
jgi:hypothetical protein